MPDEALCSANALIVAWKRNCLLQSFTSKETGNLISMVESRVHSYKATEITRPELLVKKKPLFFLKWVVQIQTHNALPDITGNLQQH